MANTRSRSQEWTSRVSRRCNHGAEAIIQLSKTSKNPERFFWGCPHWEENDCGFFKWLSKHEVHQLSGLEESRSNNDMKVREDEAVQNFRVKREVVHCERCGCINVKEGKFVGFMPLVNVLFWILVGFVLGRL